MVMNAEWIKKVLIEGADKKNMFKARLHAGEVEAIILAEESKADLIIMDDYAAKKTAKYLGYNVTVKARRKSPIKVQQKQPT